MIDKLVGYLREQIAEMEVGADRLLEVDRSVKSNNLERYGYILGRAAAFQEVIDLMQEYGLIAKDK